MPSVSVYHSTVPNQKSQEKIDLLRHFSTGAKRVGDRVNDIYDYNIITSDVAVIQGWVTENPARPHLVHRNNIIAHQALRKHHVIAVDSNLFLYADKDNPGHYLRYSFDGVFPNTGIYCDSSPSPERWQQISRDLNIVLKDYRTTGEHILLCLQRNGGWSMGNLHVVDWAAEVILTLREHTDRPIRVRPHPGDKHALSYLGSFDQLAHLNVHLSLANTLLCDDLKNCWAAVNFNSSPVVGAAIEGVPIFVLDTAKSQCAEIANTDLARIETPTLFDRQPWLERISMFHWNFNELQTGACWRHMRQFI